MAISTNDSVDKFGTQDDLDNSSSAVSDGAFSVAADLLTWTNDDDAKFANFVIECTFGAAPDANSTVSLFAQPLNIVSTSDQDEPDANFLHVALGEFPLNDVTSTQFISIDAALINSKKSQEYQFFIQNNGGETMSAGWTIHVTPKAIGPAD